jgi:tetratricopeptide (TPR) repeat protein
LVRIGNYHLALNAFRKSYNLAKKINHITLMCDALTQMGILLSRQGESTQAISKLDQALGLAEQIQDQIRQTHIAGLLGSLFLSIQSVDKAYEHYGKALNLAQTMGNRRTECAYTIEFGKIYLLDGVLDLAGQFLKTGLKIARQLRDNRLELEAFSSLVQVAIKAEDLDLATYYCQQAIETARLIQDQRAEAAHLQTLIDLYLEQELAQKALPIIEQALNLVVEQKMVEQVAKLYLKQGDVYFQLTTLEKASRSYQRALEEAGRMQLGAQAAETLGRLSALAGEQGDCQKSIEYAKKAVQVSQTINDQLLLGESYILLSFAYRDLNDYEQAIKAAEHGLAAFQELQDEGHMHQTTAYLNELRDR